MERCTSPFPCSCAGAAVFHYLPRRVCNGAFYHGHFLKCASKVAPAPGPGPGRAPLAAARSSGTRASSGSVLLGTASTKTSESSCQPGRYHDRDAGGSEARRPRRACHWQPGSSESNLNLKPPGRPALSRSQAPA
jgi:hypothetical protein